MKHNWGMAAIVAVLITLSAGSVQARPIAQEVTVVLESGDSLYAEQYEVERRFRVLKVWVNDVERRLSFATIKQVLRDGEDITADLLGEGRAAEPESDWRSENEDWVRKDDPERQRRNKALTRSFLTVSPTISLPAGDYFEGFVAGIGGDVTLHLALQQNFALSFMVGRSGIHPDEGDVLRLLGLPRSIGDNLDFGGSMWRFMIGGEYLWPIDLENRRNTLGYFGTVIGVASTSISIEGTISDGATTVPVDESDTQTKFAQRLYGGLAPMISSSVGINLAGGIDIIYAGTDAGDNPVYGWNFDIMAGLLFLF